MSTKGGDGERFLLDCCLGERGGERGVGPRSRSMKDGDEGDDDFLPNNRLRVRKYEFDLLGLVPAR